MSDLLQQFFSSQTFGVIIGAVLTAGFTWFIEYLRAKREKKLYLKKKREEVYLKLLDLLSEYTELHRDNKTHSDIEIKDFWEKHKKLRPEVKVYASQHIEEWFSESLKEAFYGITEGQVNSLAKEIRKELGIKD